MNSKYVISQLCKAVRLPCPSDDTKINDEEKDENKGSKNGYELDFHLIQTKSKIWNI